MENMTSNHTDVIPENTDDLTRTAKSGENINRFLSKFQVTGCCWFLEKIATH